MHIQPDGAEHMHIAWSRIDMDEMRAIHPGLYIDKMRDEARAIERDFALRELTNDRRPELKTQTPNRDEFEEARRKGVDITATREAIRACWDRSDNPASFAAALSDQGMVIAKGDRRDYVVVDQEGGLHGLGKRITGQTAAEVRARLGEQFRQSLPGVDEAREQIAARREAQRAAGQESAGAAQPRDAANRTAPTSKAGTLPPRTPIDRDQIRAEVTELWAAHPTGREFADAMNERGYILAAGDRRPWVIVDSQGNTHALPRMIDGANTADVRAKMGGVELPAVDTAKAEMKYRAARRAAEVRETPARDRASFDRKLEALAAKALRQHGMGAAPNAASKTDLGRTIKARPVQGASAGRGAARIASRVADGAAKLAEGAIGFLDGLTGGGSAPDPNQAKATPPPSPSPEADQGLPRIPSAREAMTPEQRAALTARAVAAMETSLRQSGEPTIETQQGRDKIRERDRGGGRGSR
jgi:hypothetical protein